MRVVVVGAGIGGLSAAIALAGEGHKVTLIERSPQFEALGAGLLLAPNAVQVLDALGVSLVGAGQVLAATQVRAANGALLAALDLGRLADSYGPSYGITRAALHRLLIRALPASVEVILGGTVEAIGERVGGVVVSWPDGEIDADLVVGADGLRSGLREKLGDDSADLRYSGTTCWRGLVDLDAGEVATEAWGHRTRVGVMPVDAGQVYYYLVASAAAGTPTPADGVASLFAGYGGLAGELVSELGGDAPPLRHDLFELERPVWGCGRVLLLGDAAHGMTPNQGQGAAMAIEDALALAHSVRAGAAGGLERYARSRHRRVRKVQLDSRRIGAAAHWSHPIAVGVRNIGMRAAPKGFGARSLRSLVRPGIELAATK